MRRHHTYSSSSHVPTPTSTVIPVATNPQLTVTKTNEKKELQVQTMPQQQTASQPQTASDTNVPANIEFVPAALRLYPLYLKLDPKRFLSDAEFNKVCIVAAGDKRRIIERILLGIYQRAFVKKDPAEVKRARMFISLHENGELEKNLEGE